MCGRFSVVLKAEELEEEFGIKDSSNLIFESYNAAPSQKMPVVYIDEHQKKHLSLMEWGFLARWAKSLKDAPRPINARLETADKSGMFKASFQKKRCLVPSSGFYEWSAKTTPKQPYYFYKSDHSLFAFAGLWSIWKQEANTILSFTIITKDAEGSVIPVHSRMPFVLNKEHYDKWLFDAKLPERSPPLLCHQVSMSVNSPKNNVSSLITDISKQD
jgi:putative SOS response-associated peptidase YedK